MFKKIAHGIIAGTLVLAAQAASADSQQFLVDGKYRGVSDLIPVTSSTAPVRSAVTPQAPAQLDKVQATGSFPAPYNNMGGGYFN